jgi:hypothetical protein
VAAVPLLNKARATNGYHGLQTASGEPRHG